MRYNIIFTNIIERENENSTTLVLNFMSDIMGIRDVKGDVAHRLGRWNADRARPFIAKFFSISERERVLKSTTRLGGTHSSIRKQFPREIEEKRKQFYPKLKDARSEGQQARLVKDKLLINNRLYVPKPYERDSDRPTIAVSRAIAIYYGSSTETAVPHLSPQPYTPWTYQTQSNPYFPSGPVDMRHVQCHHNAVVTFQV